MHHYHAARFWDKDANGIVCRLCPHECHLSEGQTGKCHVRQVRSGVLYALTYGYPAAMHSDPIEKKPLYHFLPGSSTFSIGTYGCNLACKFCQNWELSTAYHESDTYYSPEEIIDLVKKSSCSSISFTYNEATVFAEYIIDISRLAATENIPCIMVTNGYITAEAREEVYRNISAVNIDLKGFSDEFYITHTGGHLQPVLDTILWCFKNAIHTEITTLLIPKLNDSRKMLEAQCSWLQKNALFNAALHFSAFYPQHLYRHIKASSQKSLIQAVNIAKKSGLHYIYNGNYLGLNQNTYCHECGELVIERRGCKILMQRDHVHKLPIIWSNYECRND